MNDNLMETRHLSNGTTLNLYDVSRRQGADRWIVTMEARLDIPVTEDALPPEPMNGLPLASVRDVLGPRVVFLSRRERVFVPDDEKDDILTLLRDEFCANAVPYLANPVFPARFIIKQYREVQQKKALQQAVAAATLPDPS
jgi:hypothetical protein